MRYVLVGNYGVGNLGDEALKDYFLKRFPDVEWQVLSAAPHADEFPRLPGGLRSFFRPWWLALYAIGHADGVVFGGGSLLTDAESLYACFLWWWHVFVSRCCRKRVALAFQGVGPFHTRVGELLARSVCRMASHISLRDSLSVNRVKNWNLNTKIVQTFDPVFSFIKSEKIDISTKKLFIIIPRNNSDDRFENRMRELLQSREWEAVRILSLQPEDAAEQQYCRRLAKDLLCVQIVPIHLLSELTSHVAASTLVLTQRYHGALAALALDKECEVLPQREGDKLSQLKAMGPQIAQCDALVQYGEAALREWLLFSREEGKMTLSSRG